MMKLQYCSDLHLEFYDNRSFIREHPLNPVGDVLLLAGDIVSFDHLGQAADFLSFVSDHFEEVFWVPGNHEYYHGDLSGRTGSFQEKVRSNVTLLNNTRVDYKGVEMLFSTLWSAISLTNAWRVERGLNDFYQIQDGGNRFTTVRYQELHQQSVDFLSDELEKLASGPRIVVTHHVPTFEQYPPEYLNDFLNEAFASRLDGLVELSKADYWFFGHHHRNMDSFKIGETQMLTNQLGYVQNKEHLQFRPDAVIEIV